MNRSSSTATSEETGDNGNGSGGRKIDIGAVAAELTAAGDSLKRAAQLLSGSPRTSTPTATDSLDWRVTSRQLGAIHAVARRAGLSKERLAALLTEVTGKSDPSRLSRTEASDVIDRLKALAND